MTSENTPTSENSPDTSAIVPGTHYIVGGAVRDQLLGISLKDRDWVVVGSNPDQMSDAGFQKVGADFPVFLHPQTKEEYALARTERKSGRGYLGFICDAGEHVTLEQDLERRDLTINAMAMNEQGELIDPYGGLDDLNSRVLRHVSPAFSEDPLRVLRVARFAARFSHQGFNVAPETLTLMSEIVTGGELAHISPERIWQETERALSETQPRTFFEVLRECGALKAIFPELDALFGIPQPEKFHPEIDCGEHALLSLDRSCELSQSSTVRFAALIHDLGKALTPRSDWPSHHGHEKSGLKPIKALCKRLRVSNRDKKLALLSSEFHTHIHRALELRAETVLKVLKSCDALRQPDVFEDILNVCIADARGRTGFEAIAYPQADYFREALSLSKYSKVKPIVKEQQRTLALEGEELQGKALGEAIDQARVTLLRAHRASHQTVSP